jgi:adenylate cyclase
VPLAAALVVGAAVVRPPALLRWLDLKILDQHFRLRGLQMPVAPVQIVTIDDASLGGGGRPSLRVMLARLLPRLSDAGVKAIGVDLLLVEPDQGLVQPLAAELGRSSAPAPQRARAAALLRELRATGLLDDPDRALAAAMREGPVVLATLFSTVSEPVGAEPATPLQRLRFLLAPDDPDGARHRLPQASGITRPLSALAPAGRHLGHANIPPDADGTVRRQLVAVGSGDTLYPSLGLQAARVALGVPLGEVIADVHGSVRLGTVSIPLDGDGRMLLNFAGPAGTFPYTSAADVLNGRVPMDRFRNVVVLVGVTATGLTDAPASPFSQAFPSVELHATTVENILAQRFLARPAWADLAVLLLAVALPFSLAVTLRRVPPIGGAALVAGLLASLALLAHGLFVYASIWLPLLCPMLAVAATYVPVAIHDALAERRQRLFIKRAFRQHAPRSVIQQILADPSLVQFGGERRHLTILFSDIRDFTRYAARHSPEAVAAILGEYLTCMMDVVFRHEGTLDKFVGGAVMAVFGAPAPQKDHALRACRTALDMMAELRALQARWGEAGREPFRIGIGVNSGEVIVGNLGSAQRVDYTVIGDPVNLAARLEGVNDDFPEASGIIISEQTYELVRDVARARLLGEAPIKGEARPVLIYELLGMREE